ncbi:MAG: hypothetical protein ACRDJU_08510 [Actinomycetota bacterium]
MTGPVLISPVNISEGRRQEVIDRVAAEAETRDVHVLDVHTDPDHNRSVLTIAGPAERLLVALLNVTGMAIEHIDISRHKGVHPRLGAVDVVPFVALREQDRPVAIDTARRYAEEVFALLGVPGFLYGWGSGGRHTPVVGGQALAEGEQTAGGERSLPEVRRQAFKSLPPDVPAGDDGGPHPSAGAIAVGARDLLVAYNVDLTTDDPSVARAIANDVRRIEGIRALGLMLPSRGQTQVSMNLIQPLVTGLGDAFDAVAALADRAEVEIAGSELVGLAPRGAIPADKDRLRLRRPAKVLEDEIARHFGDLVTAGGGKGP